MFPKSHHFVKIVIALLITGGSSLRAGFITFECSMVGEKPHAIESLASSKSTSPPADNVPPWEAFWQHPFNLCEPSGVSAPVHEVSSLGNVGLGVADAPLLVKHSEMQSAKKLYLASDCWLPPPLSHRFFRPPKNTPNEMSP